MGAMTEESPTTTAPTEDAGLAAFKALEAKHGATPEPVAPPPPEGEAVAADGATAEADAGAVDEGAALDRDADTGQFTKKGDKQKDDTSVADPKAFEKALRALRRDGVPQSQLDSLDDSTLIEWGSKRAEAQADADRAFSELGQLKANREPAEGEGAEPVKAGQPVSFDFDEAGQPLKDNFSEDEAGAFMGLVKGATEAALGQAMQRIETLQGQLEGLLLTDAMRQLEGVYPGLAESNGREAVRAEIAKLDLSVYQDIPSVVRDASRLAGLEHQSANGRSGRDPDLSRMKDNGRTQSTQAKVSPKPKSKQERDFARFLEIEARNGFKT